VSVGPDLGQSFLTVDGVLTRTLADTAHVLDVLAGYELGDANWAPEPGAGFGVSVLPGAAHDLGSLRIALVLDPPLAEVPVDPECARAARDAAALLASWGHQVEELPAPWPQGDLLNDFTRNFAPHVSMGTLAGARIAGREVRESDVEPLTWAIWQRTHETDTLSFLSAQTRLERASREFIRRVSPYDAVLTPALARRPVMIGEIHGSDSEPWENYQRSSLFTPFTAIANISGLPAISVPLYQGDDGLPSAVQLIGRPACEGELLRLTRQLEIGLPWEGRVAQVVPA
jgi:amidase